MFDVAGRLAHSAQLPFAARLVDGNGRVCVQTENEVQRTMFDATSRGPEVVGPTFETEGLQLIFGDRRE